MLKSRHLPAAAAPLAVLLALPSLSSGWMLDDWFHRAVLLEKSRFRDLLGSLSEMFRFFHGDPDRTGRLMDIGIYPWWTYPGLKAEFLQALTVLTHRLDYALWPDSPALMHAHSLLWLGAAVFGYGLKWRKLSASVPPPFAAADANEPSLLGPLGGSKTVIRCQRPPSPPRLVTLARFVKRMLQ